MIADPFDAYPGPVVLDGGLATELERRGADLRDDLWSARVLVEDPDLIAEVHRAYIEAGAEVVIGASYQASFEGLAARGFDHGAATALFRRSVELARIAADDRGVVVAASIGPYGATLANGAEYTGDYGLGAADAARAALREFHLPRAEALASAEPDVLAIETIPSAVEAEALVEVVGALATPAWISFSCRDGQHLNDGTPIEEAVTIVAASPNVVAVGVNCTPPTFVPELIGRAGKVTNKTLVAYPNRGGTWDAATKTWTGDGVPDGFGPLALDLRAAGARMVGGCCGTGPSDIAVIAKSLRS